jgi:hypothetical protein
MAKRNRHNDQLPIIMLINMEWEREWLMGKSKRKGKEERGKEKVQKREKKKGVPLNKSHLGHQK